MKGTDQPPPAGELWCSCVFLPPSSQTLIFNQRRDGLHVCKRCKKPVPPKEPKL